MYNLLQHQASVVANYALANFRADIEQHLIPNILQTVVYAEKNPLCDIPPTGPFFDAIISAIEQGHIPASSDLLLAFQTEEEKLYAIVAADGERHYSD